MQSQPSVLIVGSLLIIVGLLLPAVTCDSGGGSWRCSQDSIALFEPDYFDDGFTEGVAAHFFPINFVAICIVISALASQGKNVFPASLSLFGLVVFRFYLIWDEIDRISYLDLSLGVAWIPLLLGAGLILWVGFQGRSEYGHRPTGYSLPSDLTTNQPE